ncbi:MAG: DUF2249 domain-containing protein [Nitrososphaerota archaeon]|jgi:uncharacterized protein (DUF2249 family)|nr:DUF2249 domain-containing protein [Nitrososphaerota archaeon]
MPTEELDVRVLPPPQRHSFILAKFDQLPPGGKITIINDHEPLHLLYFIQHERDDFDPESYKAIQVESGKWKATFGKKDANAANEEGGQNSIITSIDNLRHYEADRFSPVPVCGNASYRALFVFLKAHQFIPVHEPSNDLVLFIVKGRGDMVAGNSRTKVFPGSLVFVPANVKRGLMAETDLEAIHFVSPPPSDSDHEEVIRGLKEGSFEKSL